MLTGVRIGGQDSHERRVRYDIRYDTRYEDRSVTGSSARDEDPDSRDLPGAGPVARDGQQGSVEDGDRGEKAESTVLDQSVAAQCRRRDSVSDSI